MPNEKIYTSEDFIENEKIHASNYKECHDLGMNAFILLCAGNVQAAKDAISRMLSNIYDKEITCQKDINIEASTSVETEDTSNNKLL